VLVDARNGMVVDLPGTVAGEEVEKGDNMGDPEVHLSRMTLREPLKYLKQPLH